MPWEWIAICIYIHWHLIWKKINEENINATSMSASISASHPDIFANSRIALYSSFITKRRQDYKLFQNKKHSWQKARLWLPLLWLQSSHVDRSNNQEYVCFPQKGIHTNREDVSRMFSIWTFLFRYLPLSNFHRTIQEHTLIVSL